MSKKKHPWMHGWEWWALIFFIIAGLFTIAFCSGCAHEPTPPPVVIPTSLNTPDNYMMDKSVIARFQVENREMKRLLQGCVVDTEGFLMSFEGRSLSDKDVKKVHKYCEDQFPVPKRPRECE